MLNIVLKLPAILGQIVAVLGAIAAVATAVSMLFRLLALVPFFAVLSKAADWLDHFGIDVKGFAKRVGDVMKNFGGVPPAALLLIALAGSAMLFEGCSLFQSKGPEVVQGGVDAVVCVLEHVELSPVEIVKACNGVAIEDVNKILSAHKAAMKREGMFAPPPAPSASSCPTAKP